MPWPGRVDDVVDAVPHVGSVDLRAFLERLSQVSVRGLTGMFDQTSRTFPQTVRRISSSERPVAEGMNVRYTAVAALGLSRWEPEVRREVLQGQDVADLVPGVLGLALAGRDQGALALAVWAAVEVGEAVPRDAVSGDAVVEEERTVRAVDRLLDGVGAGAAVPTVDHAWTVVALLGAARTARLADQVGGADHLHRTAEQAARRLMAAQGTGGLFPHCLPAARLSRIRSHVGCFADQVYPVQALARFAAAAGDRQALEASARCAERIVALQGHRGQWWWHYDWRHATVVEGYPVYSVHQHAMAPMALLELREAGGPDLRSAVASGLGWLVERPESPDDLVADDLGVIWRKIGRREPRKAVRTIRAATTAARPQLHLGWLDAVFPPGPVDRECRPYELGWLAYAWPAPHRSTTTKDTA
jgi:hypothetical protein